MLGAGVARGDARLCRGEAQSDRRAAPALGQGAECGAGRGAEGTSALRRPEAWRRSDLARSYGSNAAIPVDPPRGAAIRQTIGPGALPSVDPGAARAPRSLVPPLERFATE